MAVPARNAAELKIPDFCKYCIDVMRMKLGWVIYYLFLKTALHEEI